MLSTARSGPGRPVPPLSRALLCHLAVEGLGLEEALADLLAQRAAGSPRFVVAAARLEVLQGNLLPSPAGFARIPDAPRPIPDDLGALAAALLEASVGALRGETALQWEALAALDAPSHAAWEQGCVQRGVHAPERFLEKLVQARILQVAGPEAWAWQERWVAEQVRGPAPE